MSDPLDSPPDDPRTSGSTSVLEREETREEAQPGDHERFAHYVRKDKIMGSALSGRPVIALCGKVWVPGRDPSKFPVCPVCKEIYEGLREPQDGKGGSGKGGDGGPAGGGSGT
ncbi:DUF3039 domain-containing protein [Myceligenerans salitolerans]|uniref:DUF3039 domain-containing protein n=1 Tax=Myceligenerans salitolerans TaxID=1230528 RepID=A0ABS3I4I6_9MICO|nr:DUF3039 domain-containing protein [Myceligenerans salitolerans]MBO0607880.1 DUF3039 domain-containing protein [Myceligenerans salitolerans]